MTRNIKTLTLFLVLVVMISACKKENEAVINPTFDEFVSKQSTLSMFAKAVAKANLGDFTKGPGPFTWFAPTDAAFTAAGVTSDSLNKMTSGAISYLMTYHLVNASYTSIDMIALNSISRATQLGSQVYNGSFNNDYFVNGGKLSSADNKLSNGIIHVSDKFLVPPVLRGNIPAILNATGQHSLFIAALTRAGILATLSTTSVFTILAPTDAAMIAAGYTSASIASMPLATLTTVMRYHYFNNVRLFTNDLAADASTIPTAAGANTSLTTSSNGSKIKGLNNANAVSITNSDQLGTNGVVHVIDGVLRP